MFYKNLCFVLQASGVNASANFDTSRQADMPGFLNTSLVVPTPKLWTRNEVERRLTNLLVKVH